jgi:hypothetical protein
VTWGGLLLRHLMGVAGHRQPGADVEELPDAALAGQVPNHPGQEARFARTSVLIPGLAAIACSAASRSAAKLSLPPSQ